MPVYTITEVAQRLGLDTSTLRHAILEGRVKARKSGATWLIEEDEYQRIAATITPRKKKRGELP